MILLVSGLTGERAKFCTDLSANVGFLATPSGNHLPETALKHLKVWAGDNDCFNGFNPPAFTRMLDKWSGVNPRGMWISCPDVVADAVATLERFEEWEPVIHEAGHPVALVAQDGLENMAVPWNRIEALFIGGSTRFKVSDDAGRLCAEAKAHGKLVHVGRVNSLRRMEIAARFGADSIDGSGYSKWKKLIKPAIRFMKTAVWRAKNQPLLFPMIGFPKGIPAGKARRWEE